MIAIDHFAQSLADLALDLYLSQVKSEQGSQNLKLFYPVDLQCEPDPLSIESMPSEDTSEEDAQMDGHEPSYGKKRLLIRPENVVFDTNCFLDSIEIIKWFVEIGTFNVFVPLIGEFFAFS